jgi:hypothetical protein
MHCTLMHKKIAVAQLTIDDETAAIIAVGDLFAPEHLPVGIDFSAGKLDRADLNIWWNHRSIPASRTGLREALEALNISSVPLLLKECYGLSLSDQYWIFPKDSGLTWDAVNFFDNSFSDDIGNILFGGKASAKKSNLISPDSTSDGQLKKRWKIIDGTRSLVKGGSRPFHQESLNEVIASKILQKLNVSHVNYSLIWDDNIPYSVCPDFISSGTELVSAFQICETKPFHNGDDLYDHYLKCCEALGIPGVQDSIDRMLAFDYLIANPDRHFGNFGAIRNAETLEWIGPAPLFDNGTSLWCSTVNTFINPEADTESATFAKKHLSQLDYVKSFEWLDLSLLDAIGEDFAEILSASPYMDEERQRFLVCALQRRIELLDEYISRRK